MTKLKKNRAQKKFLIFFQKKFFFIFQEIKLSSSKVKIKKLLLFQKRTCKAWKVKTNPLQKDFLCVSKQYVFLILWEMDYFSPKIKKFLIFFQTNLFSYISGVN